MEGLSAALRTLAGSLQEAPGGSLEATGPFARAASIVPVLSGDAATEVGESLLGKLSGGGSCEEGGGDSSRAEVADDEAELSCSLTLGEGDVWDSSFTIIVGTAVATAVVCWEASATCRGVRSAADVKSPEFTPVGQFTVPDSAGRRFKCRLLSLAVSGSGVRPDVPRLMSADRFFATGLDGAGLDRAQRAG